MYVGKKVCFLEFGLSSYIIRSFLSEDYPFPIESSNVLQIFKGSFYIIKHVSNNTDEKEFQVFEKGKE